MPPHENTGGKHENNVIQKKGQMFSHKLCSPTLYTLGKNTPEGTAHQNLNYFDHKI